MRYNGSLKERIFEALVNKTVMSRYFPMLLAPGIHDKGITVHSHFLTYFSTVGQQLGYTAITEYPMFWDKKYFERVEIRVDSTWFEKASLHPEVAIEFERFENGDENKLKQKLESLAITSFMSPSLKVALLIYWVRVGSMPRNMDSVVAAYRTGFRRKGLSIGRGRAALMIVKCVLRESLDSNYLIFSEFLRDFRNECLVSGKL